MKKTRMLALSMILIAGTPFVFSGEAQAQVQCQAVGPGVMVHINRNELRVTPNCRLIYKNPNSTTVTFKIDIINPVGSGYTLDPGSVSVEEKQRSNEPAPTYTVSGDNSADPNYLVATIASKNASDPLPDDIEFSIYVEDHGSIDPMVRIQDTGGLAPGWHIPILRDLALSVGIELDDQLNLVRPAD